MINLTFNIINFSFFIYRPKSCWTFEQILEVQQIFGRPKTLFELPKQIGHQKQV